MNKGILGLIIAIIIIVIAGVGIAVYKNSNTEVDNTEKNIVNSAQEETQPIEGNENTNAENKATSDTETKNKILVVYYSAQNHTKTVAEKIAKNLNADIFEIIPKDVYTSNDLNWSDNNSRVSKEHNDESLRNIELKSTKVDNWKDYDTVLIGYPIWWGIAAWPVNNFVKDNDFTGKTVIPFCTSASSGLGNSGKLLKEMTKTGNWKDGQRLSSSASDSDIKSFTDSIK